MYKIIKSKISNQGLIAIKDIKAGQEICTHYGDAYWTQMANRNPQLKKITND